MYFFSAEITMIIEDHINIVTIDLLIGNIADTIQTLMMIVENDLGMIVETTQDIKIIVMTTTNGVLKAHHLDRKNQQAKKKNQTSRLLES